MGNQSTVITNGIGDYELLVTGILIIILTVYERKCLQMGSCLILRTL